MFSELDSLKPNLLTFNTALDACQQLGNWTLGLDILARLVEADHTPTVVSMNASISACEKGRHWEMALQLLHRCQDHLVAPDAISFNAVLSATSNMSLWEVAGTVMQTMRTQVDFDFVTYKVVLAMLSSAGETAKGLALAREMLEQRVFVLWRPESGLVADLHGLPVDAARILVQLAILEAIGDGSAPCRELVLVTGRGSHSPGHYAALREDCRYFLKSLLGTEPLSIAGNDGRLLITASSFEQWCTVPS